MGWSGAVGCALNEHVDRQTDKLKVNVYRTKVQ